MRGYGIIVVVLGLAGCGWYPEPPSSYLIDRTRILATRVEVVEFGPLWPDRIGFDPDDAPIAEAMPGDRVRLSGMIVGPEGRALPSADFDALWILCGEECQIDPPRCQDIEWTTDVTCELGRGGELEFELPAVGPNALGSSGIETLAIFALEPDVDAERCRELIREPGPDLGKCGIVIGQLPIGPRWGLMVELDQAGVDVDFPVFEIPLLALLQPANRLAMPTMPVWFDADTGAPITGSPLQVHAGQRLRGEGPTWRAADLQPYAFLRRASESEAFVFMGYIEDRDFDWYFSVGLSRGPVELDVVNLEVDEDAEPGPASAVLVFGEQRLLRYANVFDFRVIEFEVVP